MFQRIEPLEFPEGRLSVVDGDVTVTDDVSHSDRHETATVSSGDGGTLTFSRLAWPGYTVMIDGTSVEPGTGPAGLLQVEIPSGLDDAQVDIRFSAPGLSAGIAALALAALATAALFVQERLLRRRSQLKESLDA